MAALVLATAVSQAANGGAADNGVADAAAGGGAGASAAGASGAAAGGTANGAGDSFLSYSGTATDHGGAILYRENHVVHYREGRPAERVVLYTCRDGAAFARKTVVYSDVLAPDFQLDDSSNGMREGVGSQGSMREVFFREDAAAAEKSGPLPRAPGLVIDAGFDEFVRGNWAALVGGQTLTMRFLVPSRLQAMGFKVQHVRSDSADGAAAEVFRLKVAGVIGWVAPSIDVYYSAKDHVLTRYAGVSDLRNAAQENLTVDIGFRAADRHPGEAHVMESARKAPLAACR